MIARVAIAAALALAGCTVTEQVLGDDSAPIATCADVWSRGYTGAACTLNAQCTRDSPESPLCCYDYAYCRMGELVMDTVCNPDCSTCLDDHSCTFGAATCNPMIMRCEPCPPTDPTGQTCTPCPMSWSYLSRNGCPTCDCAPRTECDPSFPGPCVLMDPNGGFCYPGPQGVPGCTPDDPGCSANVCSATGCTAPAPLGCFTACDPSTMPNCSQCATDSCDCVGGAWSCQAICVDGLGLSLTCVH